MRISASMFAELKVWMLFRLITTVLVWFLSTVRRFIVDSWLVVFLLMLLLMKILYCVLFMCMSIENRAIAAFCVG